MSALIRLYTNSWEIDEIGKWRIDQQQNKKSRTRIPENPICNEEMFTNISLQNVLLQRTLLDPINCSVIILSHFLMWAPTATESER